MGNVRIFMSFDLDHDEDLHDRLLEESLSRASGFDAGSAKRTR